MPAATISSFSTSTILPRPGTLLKFSNITGLLVVNSTSPTSVPSNLSVFPLVARSACPVANKCKLVSNQKTLLKYQKSITALQSIAGSLLTKNMAVFGTESGYVPNKNFQKQLSKFSKAAIKKRQKYLQLIRHVLRHKKRTGTT